MVDLRCLYSHRVRDEKGKKRGEALILGISGRKGHGKDSVASAILSDSRLPVEARRIALADPIKQICQDLFGFSREQCHSSQKDAVDERFGFPPRHAFKEIGMAARLLDEDVWVKLLLREVLERESREGEKLWLVTDVRFPNEVSLLRKEGAIIWRVNRKNPDLDRDTHPSEASIDDLEVDRDLRNDGTLLDLQSTVRGLVSSVLLPVLSSRSR